MSDRPLARCPKCRGRLTRLISGGSGVIFKGKGFYVTDYARKDAPPAREPGKADPAKDHTKEKPASAGKKD